MRTHVAIAILLTAALPLFASHSPTMPSTGDQAVMSYNDGLKYRDRAWAAEKELVTTQDEGKRAKLQQAVRKSYEADIRSQRAALREKPDFFQALTELGYALRKTGDYAAALEMYDKALALMPNYAEAIEYRGEAYIGLNRVEDARGAYLILYNGGDKVRAQLLADAMRRWVLARRSDATGVAPEAVEQLAKWLSQRSELAAQSGAANTGGSWH
jgi:tetratricopeptide (TPR) repeat protein